MPLHIRPAARHDCLDLAQVQVDSYRSAYGGFFPQAYLDHFTYQEQAQDWRDLLASETPDILLVAANDDAQVIGYVLARAEPDIFPGYDAEIAALHVRRVYQRQGVGRALLKSAVQQLQARGCASVMLWTLKGNPAQRWYEKLRGQYLGDKTYPVDDWDIVEIAYGWPDLRTLVS